MPLNHEQMTARHEAGRLEGMLSMLDEITTTTGPPGVGQRAPRRDVQGLMIEKVRAAGPAGITGEALAKACGLKPALADEVFGRLVASGDLPLPGADGLCRAADESGPALGLAAGSRVGSSLDNAGFTSVKRNLPCSEAEKNEMPDQPTGIESFFDRVARAVTGGDAEIESAAADLWHEEHPEMPAFACDEEWKMQYPLPGY